MTELLDKAEKFVLELFREKLPNTYLYHNFNHTHRVVKSTKELMENSELNVKEELPLLLAAWFHDTGYTKKYKGHEEESVKIARDFLNENHVDEHIQEEVEKIILATKANATPTTLAEKIIRDADSSHIAKDYFAETSELLRQELQLHNIHNYSPSEWRAENIKMFMEDHQFYTDYGMKDWKIEKDHNL
ncbi:MAG: HD domain-containing protein, partial [Gillisia sp.]